MAEPVILNDFDEIPFHETEQWSTNSFSTAEYANSYAETINPGDLHKFPPPLKPKSNAMLPPMSVSPHDTYLGVGFLALCHEQADIHPGQGASTSNELVLPEQEHSKNLKRSHADGV